MGFAALAHSLQGPPLDRFSVRWRAKAPEARPICATRTPWGILGRFPRVAKTLPPGPATSRGLMTVYTLPGIMSIAQRLIEVESPSRGN